MADWLDLRAIHKISPNLPERSDNSYHQPSKFDMYNMYGKSVMVILIYALESRGGSRFFGSGVQISHGGFDLFSLTNFS